MYIREELTLNTEKTFKNKFSRIIKMNKNKTIILILMLALSGNLLFAQVPELQGSGTEDDPYRIYTVDDIAIVGEFTDSAPLWSLGKYFRVENDIDDGNHSFYEAVPTLMGLEHSFKGYFDGQNYKIKLGANIKYPKSCFGLFQKISDGAKISNVIVYGIGGTMVLLDIHNNYVFSGIAREVYDATIENCINMVNVFSNSTTFYHYLIIGGIAGIVYGPNAQIKNCINMHNIDFTLPDHSLPVTNDMACVGGIIGAINPIGNNYVLNCSNNGNITEYFSSIYVGAIGGIIGGSTTPNAGIHSNTIEDCINYGVLTGYNVGGITGSMVGQLQNCVNVGVIIDEKTGTSGGITP